MSGQDQAIDNELGALRVFAQIVAAGSLSEAARRMDTSLAFVSRRLSNLEDRLRARLIDRSSRKFVLTDEGSLFHERVKTILELTDTAVTEVSALRGRVGGSLRISAPHEIGRRRIAALCSRFSAEHPDVALELSLTDVRPDVLRDDIDIALVTKRPIEGDVTQRKIMTCRRVICASPAYLEQHGRPYSPDELKHHRCIVLRRGPTLYDRWTLKSDANVQELRVPSKLVADSTDVIHAWILEGAGIAVKAYWDIAHDLEGGKLVELLPDFSIDEISLYAAFSGRRHIPLKTRKFIDFMLMSLRFDTHVTE